MNDNKNKLKDHTFIIDVKSTQNYTWQGTVTWVAEQKKMAFRSTLELIRLLDSAIGTEDEVPLEMEELD